MASNQAQKQYAVLKVPQLGSLTLPSIALRGIVAAALRAFTSLFSSSRGAPSYFKDVLYTMIRCNVSSLSIPTERKISPFFSDDVYLSFARANKIKPVRITLPSGTQAYWLGDSKAETILVYFHGGGYVYPLSPAHLSYLSLLCERVNNSSGSRSFGVVILGYSLAPEHPYPAQLRQAAELVQYLIHIQLYSPSSIIFAGDSAGASLVLSLLSHISHPHLDMSIPRISLPVQYGSSIPIKFRGVMLLSPWVSFDISRQSFKTNSQSDTVTGACIHRWSSYFLGQYDPITNSIKNGSDPVPSDEYSEPLTAPPSWWKTLPDIVNDVFIWGGGGEVMIDSIVDMYWRIKEGFVAGGGKADSVRLLVQPHASHVEMITDFMLGYSDTSPNSCPDSYITMEWIRARL